jgi:hypothetical protein
MTSKVYRTAQGKTVDLGTIMLQNEHVRAVGNMNVNARGDKLDQNNRVIETKPRQIQRQNARTTNVSADPVHTSATKAKKARKEKAQGEAHHALQTPTPVAEQTPVAVTAPPVQNIATPGKIPEGGLAAAIARQREVKQELEKTRRQQQQGQGLRKI